MKRYLPAAAIIWLLSIIPFHSFAGDYEKAWNALLKNEQKKALDLFHKAIKSNDNKDNAIVIAYFLETYMGYTPAITGTTASELFNNPQPYQYAFWFNDFILGDYGKKRGKQLATLEKLLSDPKTNGSLQAAANYYQGLIKMLSRKRDEAAPFFQKMGALDSWQFVGPFDNVNGSGFNKDYGH